MGAWNFEQLKQHIGHEIVCVGYGREEIVNVAIECEIAMKCYLVLTKMRKRMSKDGKSNSISWN